MYTDKTLLDHGVSAAIGQDCSLLYMEEKKPYCREWAEQDESSVMLHCYPLVPSTARATFPAADSHAETPNKITKNAAKRLMMPSHLNNFLHCIMIEVVEELECEPVVHAH